MSLLDLSRIPALAPPPGVTPNFINPPSRAPETYPIGYTLFALTSVGVVARIYTKAVVMKKINLEDYSLLLGWLGVLSFVVLVTLLQPVAGRHQWDVSLDQVPFFLGTLNAVQIAYVPPMLFLKLAILLQVKHIFTVPRKNLTWLAFHGLIWLNILFFTIILIFTIARCVPRTKLTDPSVPGTCFSTSAILISTSSFNAISDFLTLILPLWIISRLSVALKHKIGISAIFAVGFLGCIASILRVYYSQLLVTTDDDTWAILPVGFTAVIEFAASLLVACLPVMPALYQHIQQKNLKFFTMPAFLCCFTCRKRPSSAPPVDQTHDNIPPTAMRMRFPDPLQRAVTGMTFGDRAQARISHPTWFATEGRPSSSSSSEHIVIERPASALIQNRSWFDELKKGEDRAKGLRELPYS